MYLRISNTHPLTKDHNRLNIVDLFG